MSRENESVKQLSKKIMNLLSGKYTVSVVLFAAIVLLAMIPERENPEAFHTIAEWDKFVEERLMHAPPDSVHLFPTARRCQGCHGHDPQMNAMVDWMGNDINTHDDWASSMMANSAKDPFWRAKVSHEVLVNPTHKIDLETKCTSCHAPQGHFTALLRGADHYSITEMENDTIAMDGVSCGSCHMKSEEDLDKLFSGEGKYDTTGVMYGPFEMPFAAPMNDFVGFNPVYSEHINDAGICASCHTLLTSSTDLEGNYTGRKFVEQATYHEWLNSDFDDDGASPKTCQGCHMPRIEDNIVISANYLFLDPRAPFALHDLVGANVTMLELMKNNRKALNIQAADEHFDETIAKTLDMLQKQSLAVELTTTKIESDTAYFNLEIQNKAGHKFPSGYPSRRVFVEFTVTDDSDVILWKSGGTDDNHEIVGHPDGVMPHFNTISKENQVQIYEFVITDVNGDITTILEQADGSPKDNRLPPKGFSTSHSAYDTTMIYGAALTDSNFNYEGAEEGTGADIISYHIPLNGYSGNINVSAKIYYQSITPRFVKPMFDETTPEIEIFRSMYNAADLSPVLVAHDSIIDLFVESLATDQDDIAEATVYPNPSIDGLLHIRSDNKVTRIKVVNMDGKIVLDQKTPSSTIQLPSVSGLYAIELFIDGGSVVRKVFVR
ncbi:MAG: hypothetical protein ACI9P5_003162 [Saprospiraceae bacterium]